MENIHITKLVRVGTSLGVIVPVEILRAVGLQRGDTLAFGTYEPNVVLFRKLSNEEIVQMKPPIISHE